MKNIIFTILLFGAIISCNHEVPKDYTPIYKLGSTVKIKKEFCREECAFAELSKFPAKVVAYTRHEECESGRAYFIKFDYGADWRDRSDSPYYICEEKLIEMLK